MWDAAGNLTTNNDLGVKRVYDWTYRRLISGPSTTMIIVAKVDTTSTFTVQLPTELGLSSTPLGGKYRIKCTASDNYVSYSDDIPYHYGD